MEIKKKLYRHLLNNDFNKNQIAVLEDFLTYYVNFQDSKNNHIFESAKLEIAGGNNTMGIRELLLTKAETKGREKGREIEREIAKREIAVLKAEKQKAEAEKQKAEAEKLNSAKTLKKSGVATNVISSSLNLPLSVVEQL